MEIDWLPLGFLGSIFFWSVFIILGLLMPFFVFLNTFTLGKIVRKLEKINTHLESEEQIRERQILGQGPRPND